ncbi:MAG TPA: hypothetical protein VLT36_16820 [Candidatus Dormibacteraeota bacterium]|nr:hypothetical protein [Candidatus Dormibacteraeota bacterium]
MKFRKSPLISRFLLVLIAVATAACASRLSAQTIAYDEAGNYLVNANWTNGANQGFGFTPWTILTNGPDFHGTYINASTSPPVFVIASITNSLGTNYADVWGLFANGPTDINATTAFRGFANPLGTNTFSVQWGSRGAGTTLTANAGNAHGWCGFTLRNGNTTNSPGDFESGVLMYLYFFDGNSPSTLYVWDGNGIQSVPGTSFSDLGRGNITNAVQAEISVAADGLHYHLSLKDCVQGRTLYTLDSQLMSQSSVDSVALFCQETTGDQVYNRMQISVPKIPPTISNLQPTNGSIYLDPNATTLSFQVNSFNSTVVSNAVSVFLNGVQFTNLTFDSAAPTSQLQVSGAPALVPDTFYNLTIIARDANTNSVTNTSTFNTFLATDFYIDAYDYNYNSGQFINNATPTNGYANLLGVNNVDYSVSDTTGINNTAGYRPGDLPQILPLDIGDTGDPYDHANLRANGYTAYNIGFTDTGNWENYTRVAPVPTNYTIYARAASVAGGQFEIEKLANATASTSTQPNAALGRVNVPATGGSKVFTGQLIPLTDAYGNTVVYPLAGTNTLRCTAISSRGYNIEYLALVAVTNATSTLRPYLATANPAPNATGAGLAGQITFTLAHRQTTVQTNTLKLFTNGVAVAGSGFLVTSNAAGVTGTFTIPANLPVNSTNTLMVTFTDSASVNVTNSWTFVTGTGGGVNANGVWSGAAGPADMSWATAANWTGGTPGPGATALFASAGGTTNLSTNNIVSTNTSILALTYSTNNNGYHTTLIQDGVTLTITNSAIGTTAALQVGADNVFNKQTTNTITGPNGTLIIAGNPPGSGLANQLNFQVRQCANPGGAEQTVLDLSGLGTFRATIGKFGVGQGGTALGQSNVSARVTLARTNVLTMLRVVAGQFVIGDSSGSSNAPPSTVNLGISNAIYFDSALMGNRKSTNDLLRFNPDFAGLSPFALIRGTNGNSGRVGSWSVGDANNEPTVPVNASATVDFSAGTVDALVTSMIIGEGATTAGDTGQAQGTLALKAGTFDVSSLRVGVQRANNTATADGIVRIAGPATLISTNITLAQAAAGANASLVTGSLNVTNGTVRGNIIAGGGASTVNIKSGTLVVSNNAGSVAAPLTALTLSGASLHLKVDGTLNVAPVNATAVFASGTTITIDSVANVTSTQTVHLISYTGPSPFAGLSLAPISGYSGTLSDNSGNIDLTLAPSAVPPSPSIGSLTINAGQVIISGTNNNGAGGTYRILTATNVVLPRSNWTVLATGSFDGAGRFSATNAAGNASQRFYMLQVP